MKVNVTGIGVLEFPDTMSGDEVKAVLEQFKKKRDDSPLLAAIEKLIKNQKPIVMKEPQMYQIEKTIPVPVVETKIEVVEIPKYEKVSWKFTIERDEDDLITEIYAEPYK